MQDCADTIAWQTHHLTIVRIYVCTARIFSSTAFFRRHAAAITYNALVSDCNESGQLTHEGGRLTHCV